MGNRDTHRPSTRRWTIGILAASVLDEYQNTVVLGVHDELRERQASVILFAGGVLDSGDPNSAQRNHIYDLVNRDRLDGLIVLASLGNETGDARLADFIARYAPLPICTVSVSLPGIPSVLVDNLGGMRAVVEHIVIAHEKRRVAFVRGPAGNEEAERRFRVYREVLDRQGIAFDHDLVTIGDFNPTSGADAVRTLCDQRRVAFDALVGANDYMALAAIEALKSRGLDVPGEVVVAGFDDIDEARFASPPLTTVRQPLYDAGRQAGRTLVAILRNETRPERVVLDTLLVLRESCGCTLDQAVVSPSQGHHPRASSIALAAEASRHQAVSRLLGAISPEHSRIPGDWAEPLLDAFAADVTSGKGERFITLLDATLRRSGAAGGSMRPWHAVVSILNHAWTATAFDPKRTYLADAICHRARVLIGDVRERAEAQHRIRRERWIRTLHDTSEALMTSLSAETLVHAVVQQLPHLGIPACAMAVYDRIEGETSTNALLLLLYDDNQRVFFAPSDALFAESELSPQAWLEARPRTLVAEPLVFRGDRLGFALFEMGPRQGIVYEGLRELVSSALNGARLVEKVVEEATRRQRAERERLVKEMAIAARIQTAIVPTSIVVPGLEISAIMMPAPEVGGDYYDVVPSVAGGCWIGIGDVAGHGLQTGLVMLMIQSVVASLVRRNPKARPADVFNVLNDVMYDNVHRRMKQDEHATLTLMRYDGAGEFVFAGAHEDIVIHRAALGRCECVETRGPWVGAFPNVSKMLVEAAISIAKNDLMVLYTDGVTEAKDSRGAQFSLERVCAMVERLADQPPRVIRDHLIAAVRSWTAVQEDDMSVIVIRRTD